MAQINYRTVWQKFSASCELYFVGRFARPPFILRQTERSVSRGNARKRLMTEYEITLDASPLLCASFFERDYLLGRRLLFLLLLMHFTSEMWLTLRSLVANVLVVARTRRTGRSWRMFSIVRRANGPFDSTRRITKYDTFSWSEDAGSFFRYSFFLSTFMY